MTLPNKIKKFYETYACLTETCHAGNVGDPVKMIPYQWEVIKDLFGWRKPDGSLLKDRLYLFCPKKQNKTGLISLLAIYHLMTHKSADGLIVASKVDQAEVCYNFSSKMIRYGKLKKYVSKRRGEKQTFWIRPNEDSITWTDKAGISSKITILPSSPEGVSGPSCSLVIADEVCEWNATHAQTILDRLDGAGAARSGLYLFISTPQFNREHPGFKMWSQAKSLIDGEITDTSISPWIFGVPQDAKCICDKKCQEGWQCLEQLKLANPGFGITVGPDFYDKKLVNVKNSPEAEAGFRTLYAGQWVGHAQQWLSQSLWGECKTDLTLDDFKGESCYIGYDGAVYHDLACYVMSFKRDDTIYLFPRFFMPDHNVVQKEKSDRIPYRQYNRNGLIEFHSGERIDQVLVAEDIIEQTKDFDVLEFRYDPKYTTDMVTTLCDQTDINVVEVSQKPSLMTLPTAEFERLLLKKLLRHPNNAVLNWCCENCVVRKVNTDGEIVIDKGRSHSRIDGIVASVISISGWMAHTDEDEFVLPFFV